MPIHPLGASEEQFMADLSAEFQHAGLPDMAGRLYAHMLVADPPCQTFGELTTALRASPEELRASIEMMRTLGMVEAVSLPGPREAFCLKPLDQLLHERLERLSRIRAILDQGVKQLAERGPERNVRLREIRDFYALIDTEFPKLIENWRHSHVH